MTKKFMSMFLALAMCLALSVPAFAVEEEPELTDEPAVQTEVETEAEEEVAALREICAHIDYETDHYYEIDVNNYDDSGHARDYIEIHTCKACRTVTKTEVISTSFAAHHIKVTEFGLIMGDNGEDIITYLHACILCNYSKVFPYK